MKLFHLLLLACCCTSLFAQNAAIPQALRASMTLNRISTLNAYGNAIGGIPLPPGKVIGDTYISKNWNQGSVLLYQSETIIEGYPLRFDIEQNELEIDTKSGVKVLAADKIRNFTWIDSLTRKPVFYVNAKEYVDETSTPLSGFFEVISEGTLLVMKKTTLSVRKANYVKEFDTGSRDDKIMKNDLFYYAQGNKVMPLATSRKKFLPIFGDKAEKVKEFIDVNGMNLKEVHHLQAIFEYYNSITK
jgi:hypothetical protein